MTVIIFPLCSNCHNMKFTYLWPDWAKMRCKWKETVHSTGRLYPPSLLEDCYRKERNSVKVKLAWKSKFSLKREVKMTFSLIVLRSYHLATPSWHKMANNQSTSTVFYKNQKRSGIGGEFNWYLITERRCLYLLYLIRYVLIRRSIYSN